MLLDPRVLGIPQVSFYHFDLCVEQHCPPRSLSPSRESYVPADGLCYRLAIKNYKRKGKASRQKKL